MAYFVWFRQIRPFLNRAMAENKKPMSFADLSSDSESESSTDRIPSPSTSPSPPPKKRSRHAGGRKAMTKKAKRPHSPKKHKAVEANGDAPKRRGRAKQKRPRKHSNWVKANQKEGYLMPGKTAFIPRKGTAEYDRVMKIKAMLDEKDRAQREAEEKK